MNDDGVSFEALERLAERNSRRPTVQNRVEVRSIRDIQRVIAEFAPERQKDGSTLVVSATVTGENEQGKRELYRVSAETKSKSRRTIILEGLDVIKNYTEVVSICNSEAIPVQINGQHMSPPELTMNNPTVFIDPLVRRWFGGVRRGLRICWDLDDGYTYHYDMYNHKLTRTLNNA